MNSIERDTLYMKAAVYLETHASVCAELDSKLVRLRNGCKQAKRAGLSPKVEGAFILFMGWLTDQRAKCAERGPKFKDRADQWGKKVEALAGKIEGNGKGKGKADFDFDGDDGDLDCGDLEMTTF